MSRSEKETHRSTQKNYVSMCSYVHVYACVCSVCVCARAHASPHAQASGGGWVSSLTILSVRQALSLNLQITDFADWLAKNPLGRDHLVPISPTLGLQMCAALPWPALTCSCWESHTSLHASMACVLPTESSLLKNAFYSPSLFVRRYDHSTRENGLVELDHFTLYYLSLFMCDFFEIDFQNDSNMDVNFNQSQPNLCLQLLSGLLFSSPPQTFYSAPRMLGVNKVGQVGHGLITKTLTRPWPKASSCSPASEQGLWWRQELHCRSHNNGLTVALSWASLSCVWQHLTE